MKIFRIAAVIAYACLSLPLLAQAAPGTQPNKPAARTDLYHVHVAKAAPGKEAQLADFLKTPDTTAAMPDRVLVLAHEDGDEWDYLVIEHLGTSTTVKATGRPMAANVRDLYAWHGDTFVNGPAWPEFAKAMGIDQSGAKDTGAMYVVSVYNSVPGQRDQLEKFLTAPPTSGPKPAGDVLLMHIEGAPWNFMSISRYNSWQDFATSEAASVAQMRKGSGGWYQLRDLAAFHRDTLAIRIAP